MDEPGKASAGRTSRPSDETIAGTGPGIADDSRAPGEDSLPDAPTDEEVEKAAAKLGAGQGEKDTLPLDGE